MLFTLTSHPDTPSSAIDRIEVDVLVGDGRPGIAMMALIYRAFGNLGRVRLPNAAGFGRADGLWRHSCFEAFVKTEGTRGYLEFNFAPSGQWASYAFDSYRSGQREAPEIVALESWTEGGQLALEGDIDLDLTFGQIRSPLKLALSAVIEDIDGVLSYWALAPPPGKPDFHHPDSFALTLPPPEPA